MVEDEKCFNPLNSGAFNRGDLQGANLRGEDLRGFNPLNSGAFNRGTAFRCPDRGGDAIVSIPLIAGHSIEGTHPVTVAELKRQVSIPLIAGHSIEANAPLPRPLWQTTRFNPLNSGAFNRGAYIIPH